MSPTLVFQNLMPGIKPITVQPIGGSGFTNLFRIESDSGNYLMKYDPSGRFGSSFTGEATGLSALAATNTIRIPDVFAFSEQPAALIMEWIDRGSPGKTFWHDFADQLARLHSVTQDYFGFTTTTFCGNIPMNNSPAVDWHSFYFHQRLEPEFRFCRNTGQFSDSDTLLFASFESWFLRECPFPDEPPSLIHGDLWSGNFLCDSAGNPVLIDPSVYFGHREIDIGMSELFGGFSREFYQVYQEHYPLSPGWNERRPIAQLYHLLLHVRLFGGGYIGQVKEILRSVT